MKKLNFDNKISNDYDKLISILKESIGKEPSEQFAENTLEKFRILKTKSHPVHKPLKSPLYMMATIGLVLLSPVFITFSSQVSLPDSGLELGNPLENMAFQLDSWYTLPPMILVLVLMAVAWIELDLVKFRKPIV